MKKTITVPSYLDNVEKMPLGDQLKAVNKQLAALETLDPNLLSEKGKFELYLVWHSASVLKGSIISAMRNILNHFSLN